MQSVFRQSTFETNSSSAHTFVISNEPLGNVDESFEKFKEENTYTDSEGKKYLHVQGAFFSREFSILYTVEDKLSYVIAGYAYDLDGLITELIPIILKKLPDYSGLALGEYSQYAMDHAYSERDDILCFEDGSALDTGSIDHQSSDNIKNAITAMKELEEYKDFSTDELISEIIFNPGIIVVTGDDGDYELDVLEQGGFFNTKLKRILVMSYNEDTDRYDSVR